MTKIRPVILCGGSGTRLWPMSREDYPKQFVEFPKDNGEGATLFSYALRRFEGFSDSDSLLPCSIIASESYRFYVADQLKATNTIGASVFLEPASRNTAASLTVAALKDEAEDPILVVIPSDQVLENTEFQKAVLAAREACENGEIVLLGIRPTYPETGYGYIETEINSAENAPVGVARFVEKPNSEKAEEYVKSGTYLWNSGIFILKASTWLKALELCRPDIALAARKAWKDRREFSQKETTVNRESFIQIPSESVDYAVLEHCKAKGIGLKVLAFMGRWTDLGSWQSVWQTTPKDENGNFSIGQVVQKNVKNSLLISTARPLVCNKISNVAVIETPDAIMVSALDASQNVKALVADLEANAMSIAKEHRKGRRPWGYYDAIDEDDGFKVKRIVVKPGCSLSLQRHQHRAEHWVVVKGEAVVQIGNQEQIVKENQSVYIEKKEIHRLFNRTKTPLCLIEVQIGTYLGEDDIERLEDIYGRS